MFACKNNLEHLSRTKLSKKVTCGYQIFTQCVFDAEKMDLTTAETKIWKDLREHTMIIII